MSAAASRRRRPRTPAPPEPEAPGTVDVWLTGSGELRHVISDRTAEAFRTVCGQWVPDPPPHGSIVREVDPGVAATTWHCWGAGDRIT